MKFNQTQKIITFGFYLYAYKVTIDGIKKRWTDNELKILF